ncbi:MAG: hypothetical protein AB7V32_09425 [Candidatus Berkiella sp.]
MNQDLDYRFSEQVICDFHHFYSLNAISERAIGFGIAAVFANTDLDPEFRWYWQHKIRSDFSDKLSTIVNDYSKIATYPISVPIYLSTLWISNKAFNLAPQSELGLWANHSLRTLIVGVPEQALFTHLLGSGRPESNEHNWDWFKYHRAVSGHAFYGAIPIINAAKQVEGPWLKGSLYVLSTLPGIARINSDKHYLSQVWLGWWLAFRASEAVWQDKVRKKPQITLQMLPIENGIYLGLAKKL